MLGTYHRTPSTRARWMRLADSVISLPSSALFWVMPFSGRNDGGAGGGEKLPTCNLWLGSARVLYATFFVYSHTHTHTHLGSRCTCSTTTHTYISFHVVTVVVEEVCCRNNYWRAPETFVSGSTRGLINHRFATPSPPYSTITTSPLLHGRLFSHPWTLRTPHSAHSVHLPLQEETTKRRQLQCRITKVQ